MKGKKWGKAQRKKYMATVARRQRARKRNGNGHLPVEYIDAPPMVEAPADMAIEFKAGSEATFILGAKRIVVRTVA
jgi:hypothetical protein